MIYPSFKEYQRLARRGNLIALKQDFPADLETPVSAFLKVAREEPHAFLLESAEQEERIGRYSILGIRPEMILISSDGEIRVKSGGKTPSAHANEDLLEMMRRTLKGNHLVNGDMLPNFAGGFVGFLGYENVSRFEQINLSEKRGLLPEDAVFFLVKDFLLFDHFKKTLSLVSLCEIKGKSKSLLQQSYRAAKRRMGEIAARLKRKPAFSSRRNHAKQNGVLSSNLTKREFEEKVRKIRDYIRAGDCIQVVFSQRFDLGKVRDDFEIYRALRTINPSPYMFYFRCGELSLIGSSPELLVKKTGLRAEICPIAGTRRRGKSREEDLRLEENLKNSPKEMAEHLMLVDLGRNDLGRVCRFTTIHVNDFARVDRYSHVMHLVSSVEGQLKSGKDAFDLLRAAFPAGTVTGAPKIRAMQIIDELEPEKRGPYAGSLGYFSFNQDMDMCITIRTILVTGKRAYVQAGAGIVFDSKPKQEYQETLNKARALVEAVRGSPGRRQTDHDFSHR